MMATDEKNTPDDDSNKVLGLTADYVPPEEARLGAILEWLRRVDPLTVDPRTRVALRSIWESVEAARSPSVQGDRWLRRMARELRPPKPAFFRSWMVGLLRSLHADISAPDARFIGLLLAEFLRADEFRKLSGDDVRRAWALHKRGASTGATNFGIYSVAAELTLACGAFGDRVRPTEERHKARNRIARVFRAAASRQKQRKK